MGRVYAGILGSLAFATVTARGVVHGGNLDETILRATVSLIALALVGFAIGSIAQWMVDESVHGRLTTELTNMNKASTTPTTTTSP